MSTKLLCTSKDGEDTIYLNNILNKERSKLKLLIKVNANREQLLKDKLTKYEENLKKDESKNIKRTKTVLALEELKVI